MSAPLHVFPSPDAVGDHVAGRLLDAIERARIEGRRFLLGCPTGRTPRPIFAAMAQRLHERPQDLTHVVLVMMDEYLVDRDGSLRHASADVPWSCHHFASTEIAERLNAELAAELRLRADSIWFPHPDAPSAYDEQVEEAGGIDLFLLASGASDGHVAFNQPGSPRDSRTRIVPLAEETRRDNLQTFPSFGTLDAVPHHGVSVGVATITASRAALMVVLGAGKRLTLQRMLAADRYDPSWPATLIHECASGEIIADREAAGDV